MQKREILLDFFTYFNVMNSTGIKMGGGDGFHRCPDGARSLCSLPWR